MIRPHPLFERTAVGRQCFTQRRHQNVEHLLVRPRIEITHHDELCQRLQRKERIYSRAQCRCSKVAVPFRRLSASSLAGQVAHHDMQRVRRGQASLDIEDVARRIETICRQVANRLPNIRAFAARHDVVLFVSGLKSSNGRVLYEACREVNPRSYLIDGPAAIDFSWLRSAASVGICGATSTPKWLMEQCREAVSKKI